MIRISVIVPAFNAATTIRECLENLTNQTIDQTQYEIIVVNDGSNDGTKEIIKEFPHVCLIEQHRQRPAAARNAGIHAAQGEIICFTDADCIPAPDWIEQIITPLADSEVVGSKGIYGSHQSQMTARFVQLEYEDKYDLLHKQPQIDFIDTYSAAYRRDILLANNCFDVTFPYLEDQELSFRLAARGYLMRFQPHALVYHHHSATLVAYLRKKVTIGYWKAQVVRRFPGQGVRDSHTPQIMKIQMGLMALLLVTLFSFILASFFFKGSASFLGWVMVSIAGIFGITTLPFMRKTWSKDHLVTLTAPFYLGIRAFALGIGYGAGILRPKPGISGQESTIGGFNYLGKRAIDILGAIIGLSLTAILTPFIALIIRTTSPGAVFFKQRRVGQKGKSFTIYKFRSMHANAETELAKLVDLDRLEQPVFKLENDPRITRFGRFLRRWSLDELPQFWNVLKGDMSLIGPRPEEERLVSRYTDWQRRRLAVKPGLSGPMQVGGRGDLPLNERVQLELDYIENYTLWQDLGYILKTMPAIFRGDGAR